jgi:hypothetical protein
MIFIFEERVAVVMKEAIAMVDWQTIFIKVFAFH